MNANNSSPSPPPPPLASSGYITWSGYTRGTIDLVGIFTNTICILLFLSPKLKHMSYKFMMAKSMSNLVYFIIAFETEILTFCVNCTWSSSYLAAFNYCYVFIFFSGCLYFYTITIDVVLSLYTYCILVNKQLPRCKYAYLGICFTLFVVSIAFYGQKPFILVVQKIPNSDQFNYAFSQFGASWTNKTLQIAQNFIKIILSVIVVTAINIMNVVKFSTRFKKRIFTTNDQDRIDNVPINVAHLNSNTSKSKTTNRTTMENKQDDDDKSATIQSTKNQHNIIMTKNITRMVIVSLFVNSLCQIPFGVVFTVHYLGVDNDAYQMAASIANILVLIPLAIELFIYLLFNRLFRQAFNHYFRMFLSLDDDIL